MENVTLTLTKGEANFIEFMLTKIVISTEKNIGRIKTELFANGSLDGLFGEEVRAMDQASLDHEKKILEFYENLTGKIAEQIDAS